MDTGPERAETVGRRRTCTRPRLPFTLLNVHIQDRDGPAMGCRDAFSALQDDFGASSREMGPDALGAARVATPKTLAAPAPVPRSSVERIPPTASGGRADRAGEVVPRRAPGKGRGQMQHDAAHRAL